MLAPRIIEGVSMAGDQGLTKAEAGVNGRHLPVGSEGIGSKQNSCRLREDHLLHHHRQVDFRVISPMILLGVGGNTKAIWNAHSFSLGDFPEVRAFTTNHHDFCLVDVLKTKHIGAHMFTSLRYSECVSDFDTHARMN
jgi:hypothetical protein